MLIMYEVFRCMIYVKKERVLALCGPNILPHVFPPRSAILVEQVMATFRIRLLKRTAESAQTVCHCRTAMGNIKSCTESGVGPQC